MPDMKVVATVDGWDSLSNRQKSFINFFMKDAVLQFHKESDHFTAYIQSKLRTILVNGSNQLSPNLEYGDTTAMNGNKLLTVEIPLCSLSSLSEADLTSDNQFPDIPATLAESRTSKLVLCSWHLDRDTYEEYNPRVQCILNNSITLDPKIGDAVNSNEKVPTSLSDNTNYAVEIDLSSLADNTLVYDYKTSNFKISCSDSSEYEVYYKVGYIQLYDYPTVNRSGFCTYDDTHPSGNLVAFDSFVQDGLTFAWNYDGYFDYWLFGIYDGDVVGYNKDNCAFVQESMPRLGSSGICFPLKPPVRMIAPVVCCDQGGNEDDYLPAYLMFMELYNASTNEVFSTDLSSKTISSVYYYDGENYADTSNYYSGVLSLTPINNS